ncbi:MAG: AAA family ATPase [Dehalococcoidales bacterium]|nr:AAA family ATPase [Dehalococcoidales bacterium]
MSVLPELAQAMLQPEIYPEPTKKVTLMQTQMSFVFIAGDYVYKVKKPVNLGYLDYTTLAQRKYFCEKEVELNRRLSPETYLGVVKITKSKGKYILGGSDEAIEYAVKMRYLPQDRMMNVLLEKEQVTPEMVEKVARILADFHAEAKTSPEISYYGSLKAIGTNNDENYAQTEKYIGKTIAKEQYERIKKFTDSFTKENEALFNKRVADGRIRDCHGDLHAAHICFADSISIYDCIEFTDRFRYCDVASEVSFLAMDLDHYGFAGLSRSFVNAYITRSKDEEISRLVRYYKTYMAYVRGKVEGFKMDDPYISEAEREQTKSKATGYFDLADAYTRKKPLLLITVGLVGTGKSTVARALAKRLGLTVVSSDVTRKKLAGVPLTERHFDGFSSGIYTVDFTRRTYDMIFNDAGEILKSGDSVILDASFIKKEERLKAKQLADAAGADFAIIEVVLAENIIKERLNKRVATGSVSDGRWEIYAPQKEQFEFVDEVPSERHIIVNMSLPIEVSIVSLITALKLRLYDGK